MNKRNERTIYGRRQVRPLTAAQKKLLQTVFNLIKIDPKNLPKEFPEEVIFEVGFGGGENLVHQAKNHPNALCIGCEPFISGITSLLSKIDEAKLTNIMIFDNDAKLLLQSLPDQLIAKLFILFPDPWPKNRHHKRRFINLENLLLIHQKMKKNAVMTLATDHPGYLEWIIEITEKEVFSRHFQALNSVTSPRPSEAEIPITRYEKKALENRPGAFLVFKAI